MLLVAMNVIPNLWAAGETVGHSLHRAPIPLTASGLHHHSPSCPSLTYLPLARQIDLYTMSP